MRYASTAAGSFGAASCSRRSGQSMDATSFSLAARRDSYVTISPSSSRRAATAGEASHAESLSATR
ncbi:MAG: hypothetical protein ABEI77_09795 [Halorientalis sp.]